MLGDFYNTMNMTWHHLDYGGVLIEEVFLYIQLLEREVESITPALSPTLSLSPPPSNTHTYSPSRLLLEGVPH